MDPVTLLHAKYLELKTLFNEHVVEVRALQQQALREIVPDVAQQLDLNDEQVEWVEEYLKDSGAIFRMFRRHKFITTFTHEVLRESVLWRLRTIWPVIRPRTGRQHTNLSALRCLPLDSRDSQGRPIAYLRASQLVKAVTDADSEKVAENDEKEDLRVNLLVALERMRVALQHASGATNERFREEGIPVLQYVVIVDVEDLSVNNVQKCPKDISAGGYCKARQGIWVDI